VLSDGRQEPVTWSLGEAEGVDARQAHKAVGGRAADVKRDQELPVRADLSNNTAAVSHVT
jgi:predicted secreted protein